MISLDAISRPRLLASAAALGALALPIGRGLAATPVRGGTLRVSVDVGVTKLNPFRTRVNSAEQGRRSANRDGAAQATTSLG